MVHSPLKEILHLEVMLSKLMLSTEIVSILRLTKMRGEKAQMACIEEAAFKSLMEALLIQEVSKKTLLLHDNINLVKQSKVKWQLKVKERNRSKVGKAREKTTNFDLLEELLLKEMQAEKNNCLLQDKL